MSKIKPYFLLLLLPAFAAHGADSLEIATSLTQSGASQLALVRVERDQPPADQAAEWQKWEPLHLTLLNELGRSKEVLERVKALPPDLPREFMQPVYWQAAHAALHLGQPQVARDYLSRLLWQFDLPPSQYKAARRMVIDSYLAERRLNDAYALMLRYSQEFSLLAPAEAEAFVRELLALGGATETSAWLFTLEQNSPLRLLAELKSGLISIRQAAATARAILNPPAVNNAKTKSSKRGRKSRKQVSVAVAAPLRAADVMGYWGVVFHAAVMDNDALSLAEAREHLLDGPQLPKDGLYQASATELWRDYRTVAQDYANRAQLLQGDDMAWFVLGDSPQSSPVVARALFAFLSTQAGTPTVRDNAQLRLLALLTQAKLERTAVKLFSDPSRFPEARGISPPARYLLGDLGQQHNMLPQAVFFWRGLDQPPAGLNVEQWQMKRVGLFVAAGAYPEAVEAGQALLAEKKALAPEAVKSMTELAGALREAGQDAPATQLLLQLQALTGPAEQRSIQLQLGELAEKRGDARSAADYFLQVAAGEDAVSRQKLRYRAARNLAKAGFQEDARRQYQWLLRADPDPNMQAAVRRDLAALPGQ